MIMSTTLFIIKMIDLMIINIIMIMTTVTIMKIMVYTDDYHQHNNDDNQNCFLKEVFKKKNTYIDIEEEKRSGLLGSHKWRESNKYLKNTKTTIQMLNQVINMLM